MVIKVVNTFKYRILILLLAAANTTVAAPITNINPWTTYGTSQPNDPAIATRYQQGNYTKTAQVIILETPFHDNAILPYSKLSTVEVKKSISINSTAGEYEPASFVLQAGKQQLQAVSIKISDLINQDNGSIIASNNIDIRLVKNWFQSFDAMRRGDRDSPKRLVPELLLHDDDLVKVDYINQTNSIRSKPVIQDSNILLPFDVPANLNQQLWLTLLTPPESDYGNYTGEITIYATLDNKETFTETIDLSVRVLPFQLQDTSMLMGQFYLARLVKPTRTYFNARGKNQQQMADELRDMKAHGVNQVTVDHAYNKKVDIKTNTDALREQIKLIKEAGLTSNPIVYVDWRVGHLNDKGQYQNKLHTIKNSFTAEGIDDFWIYNQDEKKLATLKKNLHTFEAAHTIGAKNIVAVTKPKIAQHLKGYLDLALVQHKTSKATINDLKTAGVTPIAYGLPHAGEEKPETTRYTYGYALVKKGFEGTLSYAYQAGECWDDWMNWEKSNYRPNVMAYPTASDPIPTMQWEAWREAVDDLKYLETYAKLSGKTPQSILSEASANNANSSDEIRKYLIKNILIISQQ